MANQGYELPATQTMDNSLTPVSIYTPATRSVPPGTQPRRSAGPPPSRSGPPSKSGPPSRTANNGSGNSAVRKASTGSSAAKKSSGGPKQTAKKRAMERAMTPEQLAARKKQGIIGGISTAAVLIGCGVAIWYFVLDAPTNVGELKDGIGNAVNNTITKIDSIGDVLSNLDGIDWGTFFRDDPWSGNTTVTLWSEKYIKRDNGGLHLTLVNSLTDDWQKEFEVAVADWSESDALRLSTERMQVEEAWSNEKKCTRQSGKMVVCNGNFGDTGWVGIVSHSQ
jgi:hypothetical protein